LLTFNYIIFFVLIFIGQGDHRETPPPKLFGQAKARTPLRPTFVVLKDKKKKQPERKIKNKRKGIIFKGFGKPPPP